VQEQAEQEKAVPVLAPTQTNDEEDLYA
jgi:hypothetical protein